MALYHIYVYIYIIKLLCCCFLCVPRRHFYCHKKGTNSVVKYHLKRMDIVSEVLIPGATWDNKYPYMSGVVSDIDLAVDEIGELGSL